MEKYEYFSGTPEVGIVPRAPHAGPFLRHVFEQEHGRGGFSGKVSHTYHLYPPNNWLPGETRALERLCVGSGNRRCARLAGSPRARTWRRPSRPAMSIAAWAGSWPTAPLP